MEKPPNTIPISSFVVKVHSRCNLNCSYCYEYNQGNDGWRSKPKFMTLAVFRKLCERIAEHLKEHDFKHKPHISFHGGEPLLQPIEFFDKAVKIATSLIPNIEFGLQTNSTLLTNEHIKMFRRLDIRAGTSLDGPQHITDKNRVDLKGRGTFETVMKGIKKFQANPDAWGGILGVIDVEANPIEIIDFFAALDPPMVDLLEPDGTWEGLPPGKSKPSSVEYGNWLIRAFDYWYDNHSEMSLRRFDEIIEAVLGGVGKTEYFGIGPIDLITVATDGSYEAVDQIKVAYNGAEITNLDVFKHSLNEVLKHHSIQNRMIGADALSETCIECQFMKSCGGGYYPHRYSETNGFKNPSIYCSDYKILFSHIENRVRQDLATQ
jgi:uncharacterized protein